MQILQEQISAITLAFSPSPYLLLGKYMLHFPGVWPSMAKQCSFLFQFISQQLIYLRWIRLTL